MPLTPHQSFLKVLKLLWDIQRQEWQQHQSDRRRREKQHIDAMLAKYLLPLDRIKLSQRVDWVGTTQNLLPLPPLRRDAHLVPYLTIRYDGTGNETSCCRIYVLMLTIHQGKLRGVGFRIESTERNCQQGRDANDVGAHDFYHAQFVRNIRNWNFYDTPSWLPDSQPSFPVWATQPLDALLNLILTLYGAKFYLDFLKNHGMYFSNTISPEFANLNSKLTSIQ